MADEFDNIDMDPKIITRNKNISVKNIAGFLVLYTPYAGETSFQLKKEGVWTYYRAHSLRLGPDLYLSDDQLKQSMFVLKQVLNKMKF